MSLATLGLVLLMLSCQCMLGTSNERFEIRFLNYYRNSYPQHGDLDQIYSSESLRNFCRQKFADNGHDTSTGSVTSAIIGTLVFLEHFPDHVNIKAIKCIFAVGGDPRLRSYLYYVPTHIGLVSVLKQRAGVVFDRNASYYHMYF